MINPALHAAPLPLSEKLSTLRLIRTENVGPVTFFRLIETYGSAAKALEALPELSKRGGLKKSLRIPSADHIEKEYARLRKIGADIVTVQCPEYPLALAAIDDAPPVISVLGRIELLQESCLGLVGARNASLNGRKFAEKLSGELGRTNQVIVSGLARGIDTAAHKGALETGTIAVVAGGIDVVYPEENQNLYEAIARQGLIIAESPPEQKPFAQSFPRRNRIVSGISKGIVVIEATMRSGSLITARLAGEQGRDVYAVPGHPFDPRASGPNHLIRQGATLVRNANDILEGLNDFSGGALKEPIQTIYHAPEFSTVSNDTDLPPDVQNTLLNHLSFTPLHLDELIRSSGLSIPAAQTAILELELAGRIKRFPGNKLGLLH